MNETLFSALGVFPVTAGGVRVVILTGTEGISAGLIREHETRTAEENLHHRRWHRLMDQISLEV